MIISWLKSWRTLYHRRCRCIWPVESTIEISRGTSSWMAICRASPSRTTRSIVLAVLVMIAGRRAKSSWEMKLLPWAPVSKSPFSNLIITHLSEQWIDPGRTNGWHKSLTSVDVADANRAISALDILLSGSYMLDMSAGWSSIWMLAREGPALTYLKVDGRVG